MTLLTRCRCSVRTRPCCHRRSPAGKSFPRGVEEWSGVVIVEVSTRSLIRTLQIAAQCGNARYVLRFHGGYSGVLNEIENFVNVSFLGGWKDPWIKTYTRLQSAALIQCVNHRVFRLNQTPHGATHLHCGRYYLYENAGYLGSAAPQWIGPKLAGWGGSSELLRKSCWGWGLSCLLDIAATRRKQDELGRMERKVRAWPHSAAKTQALSLIRRTEVALYINLARMVLFFIPNAQWSLRPDSM